VLLGEFQNLTLLMVDPYQPYGSDAVRSDPHMDYTIAEFAEAKRVACEAVAGRNAEILVMESTVAAATVQDSSLDFVFIDAQHDYDSVTSDIAAWLPKVRQCGIIGGHDYNGRGDKRGRFQVKRAVDDAFGGRVNTERGLVWWVKK